MWQEPEKTSVRGAAEGAVLVRTSQEPGCEGVPPVPGAEVESRLLCPLPAFLHDAAAYVVPSGAADGFLLICSSVSTRPVRVAHTELVVTCHPPTTSSPGNLKLWVQLGASMFQRAEQILPWQILPGQILS